MPGSQNHPLRQNALLASLPDIIFDRLLQAATARALVERSVIYEAGHEVHEILFPIAGFAAFQVPLKTGVLVDTAWIGSSGALGLMAGVGGYRASVRCLARSRMNAFSVPALDYQRLAAKHDVLRDLCLHFNDSLLAQTQMNAARAASLGLFDRLAILLLGASSLVASDEVHLTQTDIADMLSVRRSSISQVTTAMQDRGLIKNLRGRIVIRDRAALAEIAADLKSRPLPNEIKRHPNRPRPKTGKPRGRPRRSPSAIPNAKKAARA